MLYNKLKGDGGSLINSDLFKIAMDNLYDGILITDAKGKVVYINDQYTAFTGLSRETILNKNLKTLEEKGLINQAISLKVIESQTSISTIHKYITGKQAFTNAVPIFNEDRLVGVVNVTRDLDSLLEMRTSAQSSSKGYIDLRLSSLSQLLNKKYDFIAVSQAMKETVAKANKAAPYDTTVLITGESGTGKEIIARYIHNSSPRKDEAFIRINCAAIPKELFESELFGYEKGAFTGARDSGKIGMFELADKGTILLDEIGEMPMDMQSKILRVIQEKEVQRIGSEKTIPIDVRILTSTNKDLREEVLKGDFRDDLYYRISVFPIKVPPLRDRKEDIEPLINFFLTKLNKKYKTTITIERDALKALEAYPYPGNVRELENIIEYMYILSSDTIKMETIPGKILTSIMINSDKDSSLSQSHLAYLVDLYEKTIIEDTIKSYKTLESASKVLGIHPSTLSRKMKKYSLNFSQY